MAATAVHRTRVVPRNSRRMDSQRLTLMRGHQQRVDASSRALCRAWKPSCSRNALTDTSPCTHTPTGSLGAGAPRLAAGRMPCWLIWRQGESPTCRVSLNWPKMGLIASESSRLTSLEVVTNLQCPTWHTVSAQRGRQRASQSRIGFRV